ncbi:MULTISPECIES: iron ABC transporter substrate-binding protein [Thermoanaerobacterium]|uniref:Iron complex transport system substrate-binding protein n=1 Tax=Thermoanaerobacterium butyriciformans TaxID=1702242 RepID=A0ABS4NCT6_9THEO|nr:MULTISPECIES: iron ABC transporter substrate-binding protein [Thermoanaerobacterium]MBP2071484.1 iron complex transport system substrate-binding protein [Thermoanaerobacterium butyriciformans]WKV09642.1 iron ABC transporter substrate-binding protein [Thermoanaerobacterium sp. CMT5567-10]
MLNKLKKFNVFLVVLLIFSISLSGCSRSQNQQRTSNISKQNGQTVTVTDLVGRQIRIKLPVKKVVAIGPGALRLITYIDGVNRVSGVENIDKKLTDGRTYNMVFYNELNKLPVIGQGGPDSVPDAENLVQANPDVIFVASLLDKSKADELQAKTGIPVVVLSYGKLGTFDEDVYTSLNVVGKIMGKEDRAEKLVSQIKKIQEDLNYRTKEIPDYKKPTVYIGALGFKGGHGIESTQCNYPPFAAIHAKNVADTLKQNGSIVIEREKLLSWNPDILFVDEGNFDLVKQDYQKNPNFYKSLKAVKNNNVYGMLPYNQYTTNIETALVDSYWAGKVLYPEQFKDVDPEVKANEIYTLFFGDKGKNVYNEMKKFFGGFEKIKF